MEWHNLGLKIQSTLEITWLIVLLILQLQSINEQLLTSLCGMSDEFLSCGELPIRIRIKKRKKDDVSFLLGCATHSASMGYAVDSLNSYLTHATIFLWPASRQIRVVYFSYETVTDSPTPVGWQIWLVWAGSERGTMLRDACNSGRLFRLRHHVPIFTAGTWKLGAGCSKTANDDKRTVAASRKFRLHFCHITRQECGKRSGVALLRSSQKGNPPTLNPGFVCARKSFPLPTKLLGTKIENYRCP